MGQPHESKGGFPAQPQGLRLLDRVREAIRRKHYSRRTEETYIHWIKRFIFFHEKRHPVQDSPREGVRARDGTKSPKGGKSGERELEKRKALNIDFTISRPYDLPE